MTDYEMEGPLGKKGGALGLFQSRHFAISADRGLIMWENAKKNVEKATWSWKEISRVELDKHKSARRFIVHTSTPLLLEAPTADNCDKWRHALEKVMDNRARAASVSTPAGLSSSSSAAAAISSDASLGGATTVTPMVSTLQATVQAQLAQAKAKREEEERIRASGGVVLSSESKREAEEKEHKSLYDPTNTSSAAAYTTGSDEADRIAAAKKEDERKRHNALASNLAARLKARKEGGSAAVGGSASVPPAMPSTLPPSLPRSGPTEDRNALQSGDVASDGSSAAAINAYGTGLGGFSYGGTGLPTSQALSTNSNQSYDSYGHPISPSPASPGPSRTLDFTGSAYNGVPSHIGSPGVASPTSDYQNPNGSADFSSAIPPSATNALLTSILTRLPARTEGNASQTPSSPSSSALTGGPTSPLARSGSPPPSSSPNHHTLGGATLGRTSSFKKTPTKPAMIKRVSPTATGRAGRSGRGDAVHREISVAGYDPLNDPFYPGTEPSEHTMRIAEAQAALHATRQSQLSETERKLSAVEEKRLADLREAEGIRVKAKKDIEDKRAVVAARLEAEQEVEKSKFLEKQAARDERYRQQQELKRLRKEEAERRLEQGRHDRLRRLEAQEIARRDRVSVVWEPSPTPRIGSLRNMIVPSQPRLSGTQTGGGSVKKPRSQSMGNGRSSSMKGRSSSTSALSPPDRDRRATTGAGNVDDDSERHQDDGRHDDHDATADDNNNGDDLQSNAAIADELLGGNAAAALSALVDDNGDDTASTSGAAAAPKKKKKKTGGKKSGKGRKKGSTKKKKKKVIDDNDNDDDDNAGQQSIDDTTSTATAAVSAPAASISSPPPSPAPSGIPKKKSAPKTKGSSAGKREGTPVVLKSRAARQSDITATSPAAAAAAVTSPSVERKTAEKKVVLQCDEVRLRRAMNDLKDGLLHWMVLRLDDTNSVEVEDSGKQEGMLGVEAVKMRLEEAAIQYALINVQRDISGTARVVLLSWQGSLSAGARRDKALAVRSQLVSFATDTLPIAAAVHYTSTTDITYQSVLKELPKRDTKVDSATAI